MPHRLEPSGTHSTSIWPRYCGHYFSLGKERQSHKKNEGEKSSISNRKAKTFFIFLDHSMWCGRKSLDVGLGLDFDLVLS